MVKAEVVALAAVAARPHQRRRPPGRLPRRPLLPLAHRKPCRLQEVDRAADLQARGERNPLSLHLHRTGGAGRIMDGTDKGALTQIGEVGPSPVGKATK